MARQGPADVDAEDSDGRGGADADTGGDPAEPGEGAIAPLDGDASALRRTRLAETGHACTVRKHPDAHMKICQLKLRIC